MQPSHRPLTAEDLLPRPLHRLGRQVYVHSTIPSTNTFLLEQMEQAGDGAVAWAESQTAGRGRLGRRWLAPRGSSILLSVLLLEPVDSPLLPHAALLGTVAACEAIEAATDCSPAVRWPNDIFLGRRKVGGVLAESCRGPARTPGAAESDPSLRPSPNPSLEGRGVAPFPDASLEGRGVMGVVIGVGINCLQHRRHFEGELHENATSLDCETRHPVDRAAVAAGVLARLDDWLTVLGRQAAAWARLRAVWRQRCEDIGKLVALEHDGRTFTGTAVDISDDGDLIVQLDHGGRRHFASATTTRGW